MASYYLVHDCRRNGFVAFIRSSVRNFFSISHRLLCSMMSFQSDEHFIHSSSVGFRTSLGSSRMPPLAYLLTSLLSSLDTRSIR